MSTVPTLEEITGRIRAILADVLSGFMNVTDIRLDEPLVKHGLALDSVALFEVIVRIENEFNILLDDDRLTSQHLASLDALAKTVWSEVSRQTGADAG